MKSKIFQIIVIVLLTAVIGVSAQAEQGVTVGRISHIEGELLRYVPENKDWVTTVKDAPFGFNDALYSGRYSKAEIIMPNNTWIRIGNDTQLQLISASDNLTEADVGIGMARFYNRSSFATVRVSTPFGYITAPPSACFDVYVSDNSAEVIALNSTVDFVHINGGNKYEVKTGLSSVIADKFQIRPGSGRADSDWNSWNVSRNHIWEGRTGVRGESVRYLPEPLHTESYVFEENGRWERVYYENEYRYFWRPIHVTPAWAPFTVGRWTTWYGDNCWIPAEPFGYVTHHYGNWLYVNNFWYWAPPVVSIGIGPAFSISFGWYPGRVSWIYSGVNIGWVILAPHEKYHCHRYWGPHSVVVSDSRNHHIRIGGYRYVDRAVVIHRDNFYHVSDYSRVKIAHLDHATIVSHYKAAPVINHTVIHNYDNDRQRHYFSNTPVTQKPHHNAVNRIYQNEQFVKGESRTRGNLVPDSNLQRNRHSDMGRPYSDRVQPSLPNTGTHRQSDQERRTMQPIQPSESGTHIQRPPSPSSSGSSGSGTMRHSQQPIQERRTMQPSPMTPTQPSQIQTTPTQPSEPRYRHNPSIPSDSGATQQFRQPIQERRTMQPSPMTPTQPSQIQTTPTQPSQSIQPRHNVRPQQTETPQPSVQPRTLQRSQGQKPIDEEQPSRSRHSR